MKKLAIIFLFSFALLLVAIIAIPLIFKNDIQDIVLAKANETIDATIAYDRLSVSMFRSFPDVEATFKNVSLTGKNEFEGDTLVSFSSMNADISLIGLILKKWVIIKSLKVDKLRVHMCVNDDGTANWKIARKTENKPVEKPEIADTTATNIRFLLEGIQLNEFNFIYENRKGNYLFGIDKAAVDISGEMEGMLTNLEISLESPDVDFIMGKTSYFDSKPLQLATSLVADMEKMAFTFKTEGSEINKLPLSIEGGFEMPDEGMLFDLDFNVPDIEMSQLIAMLPGGMKEQVEEMEASGIINFSGKVKGLKQKKDFPLIDVKFNILDGVLKYPGLPDELKISEASASVYKPQGNMDKMTIGLEKFNMNIADNPLSLHANFSHVTTDPYMDVKVDGIVDLATLTKVFPLEGVTLRGLFKADAAIKGNYSSIKEEDYTAFFSRGSIGLKNFYLQNNSLPKGVTIENASIEMHNQDLRIRGLEGKSGRSDFSLSGRLANFINYAMGEGELQGRLVLTSPLIDVNEFLAGRTKKFKEKDAGSPVDSISAEEQKPITLPARMHLIFQSNIASLLYDKLEINTFKGKIELKDQKLTLSGIGMNLLEGSLGIDGTIIADGRPEPDMSFDLNVNGLDLPAAWRDISIVQKYLPFAEQTEGEFSTIMKVSSKLGSNLKMILADVSAKGNFSTKDVRLVDKRSLASLKNVIQSDKLENLELDDCSIDFEIKNGTLSMKPFKTAFARQPITISGNYNLGGVLDFRLDTKLKKEILSKNIQDIISYVPGHESVKTLDVGIDIDGDIKKPEVKFDGNKIKNQVIEQVRKSSKEELQNAAKKLFDRLLN
ncbi:MAG: AsmA family protein [Prolixibacteraceae bacterium]|nr:AsmA family protein [Prolixibacteraceae bacterium]